VFANIAYITAMSPQELMASNAVAVVSDPFGSVSPSKVSGLKGFVGVDWSLSGQRAP